MAQTQHTPGPWDFVSLSGYGGPFAIRMEYRSANPDAPKTYYGVQSVRRREDAHLIAAAPDMLMALKRLVEWNGKRGFANPEAPDELLPPEEQSIEVAEGMAAIAKAEGSTYA